MKTARLIFLLTVPLLLAAKPAGLPAGDSRDPAGAGSEQMRSVALVGDAIIVRQVRCLEKEPAFMRLVKLIRKTMRPSSISS